MTDLAERHALSRSDTRRAAGLGRRLVGEDNRGWALAASAVAVVVLLPILSVVGLAITARGVDWAHLGWNVLPPALWETGLLLAGVTILTGVVGTLTAWLVTMYRFPGVDIADRLLVLPLAVPAYIVAYCYVDLFDYAGPVQSGLRTLFGWRTPRDYWFPDIRSVGGAVIVFAAVLYPYVYIVARASFARQSACALEVARTLGRTPWGVFRAVALPLARPAIAAGIALALMETLNDLGAAQHLGVRTLSAAIYSTWQQRSDLGTAVQLALLLLGLTVALIAVERASRHAMRTSRNERYRTLPIQRLDGVRGWAALAAALLPAMAGFGLPMLVLVRHAILAGSAGFDEGTFAAVRNSALLATIVAALSVALALVVAFATRIAPSPMVRAAGLLSGIGYALPGTVLAIGVLYLLTTLGRPLGVAVSGTIAAVAMACVVRYLAVASSALEDGFGRISPNLDAAARTLGLGVRATLQRVHVPLLLPAIASGALMVFVDTMKELPLTLLLRPFGFDTLATLVYNRAALEQFELSALGCLMIVGVGLVPVLLLHRVLRGAGGQ